MTRKDLETYLLETYPADTDFPWARYPNYQVFRHSASKKWFALVMEVPKEKLGLLGKEPLEVVNLKCESAMIGALRMEPGFFPAYHMNKDSWITAALDGSVSDAKLKLLLDASWELTAPPKKRGRGENRE